MAVDTILHNAKIATNGVPSFVEAIALSDGKVTAIGANEEILRLRGRRRASSTAGGAPSFLD
jgi:predicted amidohydrolase YtcJ